MSNILAQGSQWRLSANKDTLCLELLSEYGVIEIEVKPEAPGTQGLLRRIERNYEQLRQLGTVKVEVPA